MQWLRLRPESPEELDMVDWRGRWIDEDDEYDSEEDEEEEDRQMEDFDPVGILSNVSGSVLTDGQDAVEGEEDDDEEEEEEEEAVVQDPNASKHGRRRDDFKDPMSPQSPASSIAPRTPQDRGSPPAFNLAGPYPSLTEGKVKAIRQWSQQPWLNTMEV